MLQADGVCSPGNVLSFCRQHGALTLYVWMLCVYISYIQVMSNLHLWLQKQVWPRFDVDGAGDGRRDLHWRNALLRPKSKFWSKKETYFFWWQWVSCVLKFLCRLCYITFSYPYMPKNMLLNIFVTTLTYANFTVVVPCRLIKYWNIDTVLIYTFDNIM